MAVSTDRDHYEILVDTLRGLFLPSFTLRLKTSSQKSNSSFNRYFLYTRVTHCGIMLYDIHVSSKYGHIHFIIYHNQLLRRSHELLGV